MQTPSFGQPFQPDFSPLPHKNNDIFGDDIFRNPHQGNEFSNSVMKPIGTGKPSHSVAAISPDLRNSFQDIMNPTVSHFNASVQGATVAKAFPIHLPPPNVRMFNVPPPPLHQMPPAVEPIQPEPMSGAMFFANIQSRLMTNNHPQNQNPNPSSEPSSGDSVQFKVIEEGKKKWPFMSQEKILEGLNKVRHYTKILMLSGNLTALSAFLRTTEKENNKLNMFSMVLIQSELFAFISTDRKTVRPY